MLFIDANFCYDSHENTVGVSFGFSKKRIEREGREKARDIKSESGERERERERGGEREGERGRERERERERGRERGREKEREI